MSSVGNLLLFNTKDNPYKCKLFLSSLFCVPLYCVLLYTFFLSHIFFYLLRFFLVYLTLDNLAGVEGPEKSNPAENVTLSEGPESFINPEVYALSDLKGFVFIL